MLELKVSDGGTEVVLQFEHSLLSLSKWESRTKVPFLSSSEKEAVEMIDYFQDMLLGGVDPNLVLRLMPDQQQELIDYINSTPSASSVPESNDKGVSEVVTSELIYYWMTVLKINWEAEKWHLSRLMMLIRISNYKAQPEKTKKSQADQYADWAKMNEENQKLFGEEA